MDDSFRTGILNDEGISRVSKNEQVHSLVGPLDFNNLVFNRPCTITVAASAKAAFAVAIQLYEYFRVNKKAGYFGVPYADEPLGMFAGAGGEDWDQNSKNQKYDRSHNNKLRFFKWVRAAMII